MALNGSLTDFGIVDLVQFPHNGRKTGALLVIADEIGEARLFYKEGRLVHASTDLDSGMDVLVDVIGLTRGDFEFRLGEESEEESIELDLHRAVMMALKIFDERKKEEEEKKALQEAEQNHSPAGEYDEQLTQFVKSSPLANFSFIIGDDAETISQSQIDEGPPEELDHMKTALISLLRDYPRDKMDRIIIEDSGGTVVLQRIKGGKLLCVLAEKTASLGAVSIAVSKFAGSIG